MSLPPIGQLLSATIVQHGFDDKPTDALREAMVMSIAIHPIGDRFAAERTGLDLSATPDDTDIAEIWRAIDKFSVLVFGGQSLTEARMRDFAAGFGPLEIGRAAARPGRRHLAIPRIGVNSNLKEDHPTRDLFDRHRTIHRGRPHDETKARDPRRATTLDVDSTLSEAA
jgi:alpha-ketoglutarate-dependent taurine dioxygenase